MKIWVITDTHFNHRKLELPENSNRPADFEQKILDNCLRIVKEGDTLIHLGDVCIGNDAEMLALYWKPIPGRKILVRGNHDNKSAKWYMEHGFDFVCDSFSLDYGGHKILFTHQPQVKFHGHSLNIHGHWHDNDHRKEPDVMEFYNDTFHRLLAIEKTNYSPLSLDTLITPPKRKPQ